MATSKASGSQLAVISTEHTLTTITDAGSYVLTVDTNAMALGDKLTLRAKMKVNSSGTTRLAYTAFYAQVQGEPQKLSIPIASVNEIVFTLQQTAGTGRTFLWEVVEL